MCMTIICGVLLPKSRVAIPDNISNGEEVDLGGTMGSATSIALVLNLLTFKFIRSDSSCLQIFILIPNLWSSLPSSLFSTLSVDALW